MQREQVLAEIVRIEELEEKIAPTAAISVGPITVRPCTIVWETL